MMPAMQTVFFETGKGGIGYVLAIGFGVAMASDQAIDSISTVLLIGFQKGHDMGAPEANQFRLTEVPPRQGSA